MLRSFFVPATRTSHATTWRSPLLIGASVLAALLACSPALAEDATETRGAWALEFEVQPRLGAFGAAGIAAKRHFTDRSALRLGFLVGITDTNDETISYVDTDFPFDTTHVTLELERYYDRRDVTLFLHFVRFLNLGNRFGTFVEAGPTVRWISEESGYVAEYPAPGGTYRSAADRDSWNYGLDLAAGFEWFFSRQLSLAGRYGLAVLLTDADQTSTFDFYNPYDGASDRRLDVTHSDGSIVQTTPAVISLTAYF